MVLNVHINPLKIRQRLGRKDWEIPIPWCDAWCIENKHEKGRIIVSYWWEGEIPNEDWIHASISWRDRLPTYEEIKLVHYAVFGDSYAYQVFVPSTNHVTYHDNALHLWGRTDEEPVLPEFSQIIEGLGRQV